MPTLTATAHETALLEPCTGAIVAAATDITFNLRGYVAVLANDVLTSLYLIMVKNSPAGAGLSTTGEAPLAGWRQG